MQRSQELLGRDATKVESMVRLRGNRPTDEVKAVAEVPMPFRPGHRLKASSSGS